MRRAILTVAMVTSVSVSQLRAEGVNLGAFAQETQKVEGRGNGVRLVWWIPTEYWKEAFKSFPAVTQEQKDEFYKTVDDYIVLCVLDAQVTPTGTVKPVPRDELLGNLSLSIDHREGIKPLADSEVSSEAKSRLAKMKPVLANTGGQLGEGMELICFKGLDSEGRRLLDPARDGRLSVKLADSTFRYRLPLGSLMPPKYDPETGEEFPGNYLFNPFTGKKLVVKPAASETKAAPEKALKD